MDPITLAIIAAISAGAASGATDVAKSAIVDGYNGLKNLIKKKWGGGSAVATAVDQLQAKPDSEARKSVLAEEVTAAKASDDPEIAAAAKSLLALIQKMPGGEKHIQSAQGIGIAQADRGGKASVQMGYSADDIKNMQGGLVEDFDREKLKKTGQGNG
jgi:hypothetical protein